MQLAPERVLGEMASMGITATELGAIGWLPFAPEAIRAELAARGLALVGGFVPVRVGVEGCATVDELERSLDVLAAAGAEVAVFAAVAEHGFGGTLPSDARSRSALRRALKQAEAVASSRGLEGVVHPHAETLIEDADTIEWLVAESDTRWCLDTGHLEIAGVDPAAFAARQGDRVAHVHLKDVDLALATAVRERRLSLLDATRRGLFKPLGEGDSEIAAVLERLDDAGYAGWHVLEQDVTLEAEPQPGAGPAENVRRSLEFLARVPEGSRR